MDNETVNGLNSYAHLTKCVANYINYIYLLCIQTYMRQKSTSGAYWQKKKNTYRPLSKHVISQQFLSAHCLQLLR